MKYKFIRNKFIRLSNQQTYALELRQLKRKALLYRLENIDITEEEANTLNTQLSVVSSKLEKYGYDIENDDYIDFINYVPQSEFYHQYMW